MVVISRIENRELTQGFAQFQPALPPILGSKRFNPNRVNAIFMAVGISALN